MSDIINLPEGYRPSDTEPFMNPMQQAYFRQRLLEWKNELIKESALTIDQMQNKTMEADAIDIACQEINETIELRTRDRERKLISKIDDALLRLDDGTYGYCEETGEPIGLSRLQARPIATLSLESQERHERNERLYRKGFQKQA